MSRKQGKVIRVRVSEEEFRALSEACESSGISNISDLAVRTMREIMEAPNSAGPGRPHAHLWVKELVSRLNGLQAEIERLEVLLDVNPER